MSHRAHASRTGGDLDGKAQRGRAMAGLRQGSLRPDAQPGIGGFSCVLVTQSVHSSRRSSSSGRMPCVSVLKTPVRAPRANAICERFLGAARRECLDHMIVLGERHLLATLIELCRYFNNCRNHQGIGQLIPAGTSTAAEGNGSHHNYRRAA